MKKNLLTSLVVVAALVAGSPAFASSITFTASDVSAGATWTETATYASSLKTTVNNSVNDVRTIDSSQSVTRTKTVKVTAAGGDNRIDAMEVRYSVAKVGGNDVTSVLNKSYLVTVTGNNVAIAYVSLPGSPSDEEVAFVKMDNSRFGQFRALNKILGGRTLQPGDAVKANANDAAELVNASGDVSVNDFSLTLQSIGGDDANPSATFAVSLLLSSGMKGNGSATTFGGGMALDLDGTIVVNGKTTRATSISLSGPVTTRGRKASGAPASSGRGDMTVTGSGQASFDTSYTF